MEGRLLSVTRMSGKREECVIGVIVLSTFHLNRGSATRHVYKEDVLRSRYRILIPPSRMMSPQDLERATWLLGPWVCALADVLIATSNNSILFFASVTCVDLTI